MPSRLARLRRSPAPTSPAEHLRALGVEPVSRHFGADRGAGKPVDRWWIERFLAQHRADVHGRVLEIAESTYTQWYGDGDVTRSDVLFAAAGHPDATVIGDLVTGEGMPPAAFDCFLCTQTLHVIDDVGAAVRGIHDTLAPGGVALVEIGATQAEAVGAIAAAAGMSAMLHRDLAGRPRALQFAVERSHLR